MKCRSYRTGNLDRPPSYGKILILGNFRQMKQNVTLGWSEKRKLVRIVSLDQDNW